MTEKIENFRKSRVKDLKEIYSDNTVSSKRLFDKSSNYSASLYNTAIDVRNALSQATNQTIPNLVENSKKIYTINPIYASLINYLSNMFMWRYVVTPHNLNYDSSELDPEIYNLMLENVEGLNLETTIPNILSTLFIEGSCYFTAALDEETSSINTLILPAKYCKVVGSTQFGTSVIQLDYSYFDSLSLNSEEMKTWLSMFPEELQKGYKTYKNNNKLKWQILDPRFSSAIVLNEQAIPTLLYTYGSVLNYEQYGDNELTKNGNMLKYIVVHKMPLYQDRLIFDTDEVKEIHKSLSKIVNSGNKTRLITTYGDVQLQKIQEEEGAENKVLSNSFNSIFNNGGLNNTLFTGNSVSALNDSLIRDKSYVWKFVTQIMNFYNIALNNLVDFGDYQADLEMLFISQYGYEESIAVYKDNASLGIGKIEYIVASGIKQKHIQDKFNLEKLLKLDQIKPLQSSYTQSSADTKKNEETQKENKQENEVDNSETN